MPVVIVGGKTFETCLTEQQISRRVAELALQINEDLGDAEPVFLPVLNGSFFFAAELLKNINFPYEISFIKLASYSGMQPGRDMNPLIGLDENLKGRRVVIVEDIVDTGRTMNYLLKLLKEWGVSDIKIATLILKPASLQFPLKIDYTGFETAEGFLIGYGLDFDKKGRHFRDIYKLITH